MISLHDYILEKFSVAGNESDKILLFDVDDTLLKSEVQVHVVKGGKLLRKLSSAEYNSYKLQPGEDFDYVEFEDPKILNNKSVFLKYWDTLQREYKSGTHIGILTARSDSDMFYDFFKNCPCHVVLFYIAYISIFQNLGQSAKLFFVKFFQLFIGITETDGQ